jgi:hypothetical protein
MIELQTTELNRDMKIHSFDLRKMYTNTIRITGFMDFVHPPEFCITFRSHIHIPTWTLYVLWNLLFRTSTDSGHGIQVEDQVNVREV